MKLAALLILLLVLATGCDVCTLGSGNVVSQTRDVEAFDRVSLRGRGNIYLTQNGSSSLRIDAEDNILALFNTSVENGELIIEAGRDCVQPREPINIYVSVDKIREVRVSGFGSVQGRTPIAAENLTIAIAGSGDANLSVTAQSLTTEISGSGDITYDGSVQEHTVIISGSGDIDAPTLATERTSISISGSGDTEVFAQNALDIRISGSGEVRYKGTPQLSQSISGRGVITQLNETIAS